MAEDYSGGIPMTPDLQKFIEAGGPIVRHKKTGLTGRCLRCMRGCWTVYWGTRDKMAFILDHPRKDLEVPRQP
jgi:hypothetical protein